MKKVLLFLIPFLLLSPAAEAAKPIPALKDTASYKSLRDYVLQLEEVSTATGQEKQTYTAELAARVQAAEAQVVLLFDRRKKEIEKNYDSLLKKRYRQIEKRAATRQKDARRARDKARVKAKRQLTSSLNKINQTYRPKMQPLKKRIADLRKQKGNSNDPREQALIDEEINLLQRKVSQIESIIKSEGDEARGAYRGNLSRINKVLKNSLKTIKRQESVEKKEAKKAWRAEKKEALSASQNQRRIDNALVAELKARGQEAIAAMTVSG